MANKNRRNKSTRSAYEQPDQPQQERAPRLKTLPAVSPRNESQKVYMDAIENNTITISSGPAGAGKTYISVYEALKHHWVKGGMKRIIITRPAVEAGEKLGFLPGGLEDKVDPYMRPIYDSLYDIIGVGLTKEKIDKGLIEIAPLAYMRGRAQPLDSLIATPNGFVRMGDVKIGMVILGSNGKPTEIIDIFPQGKKLIYRITFSDGTFTMCSEDHLWSTRTLSEKRHSKGYSTKTTAEIRDTIDNGHVKNHEIPITAPCEFIESSVPIDPYVLGALLGDGSLHEKASISLTSVDEEIIQYVGNNLPAGVSLIKSGQSISYRCSYEKKKGNPLRRKLEELNLIGSKSFNKFIPYLYKFNSVDVRLAILQGLLDTDGSIMPHKSGRSRVQFYSTSEQLADDVQFIVQSLGGTATKLLKRTKGKSHIRNNREIKSQRNCFILDIRLPKGLKPFRLSRKLDRFSETPAPQRLISSVEPVSFEECQCIRVSSPDSLYLTDYFILTHNTFNNCFIILDEAQNATFEQLKMAVTRIGENCKMVINGDPNQTDLPKHVQNGLRKLVEIVKDVPNVAITEFTKNDIVRSRVVADLVAAFEHYEEAKPLDK